jgi:RND family efflux transporter MFP subunit
MKALLAKGFLYALPLLAALAASGQGDQGLEAITKPSQDVKLSFVRAGQIAAVHVKEGDHVQAGQLLMEQDDKAERLQLLQQKAQAEDTTRILHADALLQQKKTYLARLQTVEALATTPTELELAKLDVTIAELSKHLTEFEHAQDQRKYEELKAQVERMRLTSPISGKVEMLAIQAGESAEPQTSVVRVVNTDPLWVDVYVPLEQAAALKLGCPGRVVFEAPGAPAAEGKVIYVASVAEAASGTLLVRLEVPNPSGRPAGERVRVSFPPADASATRPVASQPATPLSVSPRETPGTKE